MDKSDFCQPLSTIHDSRAASLGISIAVAEIMAFGI
jgi:hypothetical protein